MVAYIIFYRLMPVLPSPAGFQFRWGSAEAALGDTPRSGIWMVGLS